MKIIDKCLLDETTAKARVNPRLRMNYNLHDELDNPINRLINAMEPGTYLRPHRHSNPDKEESFLVLRGKAAFFVFDEEGNVIEKTVLCPAEGVYGADIKAGIWHGMLILEPETVVYEAKQGPYAPLTPENMAWWSPDSEDTQAVKVFLDKLQSLL